MTNARAEFRVFGHGIIDIVQSHMWNGRTVLQQRRALPPETYVLSRLPGAANVKLRDALLDVKTRQGDTAEGYQIYRPLDKLSFPLTSEQMAAVGGFLCVEWIDAQPHATVALDAFLEAAGAHPDLALMTVTKERFGFTIGDTICEYARVYFNDALLETACVESERHEQMAGVIEGLGLLKFANTSYLDAASRIAGFRRR